MPRGSIKKVVPDRGFGFIRPERGPDVFFHCSSVRGAAFESLSEGQAVEYELEPGGGTGGKGPRAASVSVEQ
jgi:CspA family cold shock protein